MFHSCFLLVFRTHFLCVFRVFSPMHFSLYIYQKNVGGGQFFFWILYSLPSNCVVLYIGKICSFLILYSSIPVLVLKRHVYFSISIKLKTTFMDKSKNLPPVSSDNFWKYLCFFFFILMTTRDAHIKFFVFFKTACVECEIQTLFCVWWLKVTRVHVCVFLPMPMQEWV